jgi:hypothetical protein
VKKETTKENPLRRIQKTKACDISLKKTKLHTVQWVSETKKPNCTGCSGFQRQKNKIAQGAVGFRDKKTKLHTVQWVSETKNKIAHGAMGFRDKDLWMLEMN